MATTPVASVWRERILGRAACAVDGHAQPDPVRDFGIAPALNVTRTVSSPVSPVGTAVRCMVVSF